MKKTMHNLTKNNVSSSQFIMRLCHLHGFTQVHIAHLTVILVQSQKNPVSAFLRIRKVFATGLLLAEEFPAILENVRILYKISR